MNARLSQGLSGLHLRSGEVLIQWREPTLFRLKNEGLYFLGVAFVPSAIIAAIPIKHFGLHPHTPQDWRDFKLFIEFALIICAAILLGKLVFKPSICLNENGIKKSDGRNSRWSAYKDILSCSVSRNVSHQFYVLEFTMKDEGVLFRSSLLKKVGIPKEANLEPILQIFRDKGVNVIDMQLPS